MAFGDQSNSSQITSKRCFLQSLEMLELWDFRKPHNPDADRARDYRQDWIEFTWYRYLPEYSDDHLLNSITRLRVANEKASTLRHFTIDEMKAILTDRSDLEYPIWRTYQPDNGLQEVGSVATIIMDLKAQKLHIRKGNIKCSQKERSQNIGPEMKAGSADHFVIAFNRWISKYLLPPALFLLILWNSNW